VRNTDIFVSGQTMRPFNSKKKINENVSKEDILRMQLKFKEDLRDLITDAASLPNEIVFVNRNMN